MSVAYGQMSIIDVTDGKGFYTLQTDYSFTQNQLDAFSEDGRSYSWTVSDVGEAKIGDTVFLRMTNSDKNGYCLLIAEIEEVLSSTNIKCKSIGLVDKGDTGEQGDPLTIKSKSIKYVTSSSGTTAPTSGWQNTIPSVPNGQYLWTKITTVYSDDTPVVSYSVSYMGTDGENGINGYVYMLEVSSLSLGIDGNGDLKTGSFTMSGYTRDGSNETRTAYTGRFLVEQTVDGTTWTQVYKSSANESTKTITLTMKSGVANTYLLNSNVKAIRTTLFAKDGTTNALDKQTTIIIKDGIDGATGNGILKITEMYLATDQDKNVTHESSGWTESIQTVNSYNKYLWNYEVIQYTNGESVSTDPILIGMYSDNIETIENIYYSSDKVIENLIPFDEGLYGVGTIATAKALNISWSAKSYDASGTQVSSTTLMSTGKVLAEDANGYTLTMLDNNSKITVHKWNKDGTYASFIETDESGSITLKGSEWSPNTIKYVAFEVKKEVKDSVRSDLVRKQKANGIVFLYGDDGIIYPVGTSTSSGGTFFTLSTYALEKGKTYRLTGGYDTNHCLRFRVGTFNFKDDGNGYVYTCNADGEEAIVQANITATMNGKTIADDVCLKPMLIEYDVSKYNYDNVEFIERDSSIKIPLYPKLPFEEVIEVSDTVRETWTKTVPKFNADYKYYFSATQIVSSSGVSWTNMIYDPSIFTSFNQNNVESEINNRINGIKTITDLVNEYLEDIQGIDSIKNEIGEHKNKINSYDEFVTEIKESFAEFQNELNGYSYIKKHMMFNDTEGLVISGTYDNEEMPDAKAPFKAVLSNDSLRFTENDNVVSFIRGNQLYIGKGAFTEGLLVGGYYAQPSLITDSDDYGGVSITWEGY